MIRETTPENWRCIQGEILPFTPRGTLCSVLFASHVTPLNKVGPLIWTEHLNESVPISIKGKILLWIPPPSLRCSWTCHLSSFRSSCRPQCRLDLNWMDGVIFCRRVGRADGQREAPPQPQRRLRVRTNFEPPLLTLVQNSRAENKLHGCFWNIPHPQPELSKVCTHVAVMPLIIDDAGGAGGGQRNKKRTPTASSLWPCIRSKTTRKCDTMAQY